MVDMQHMHQSEVLRPLRAKDNLKTLSQPLFSRQNQSPDRVTLVQPVPEDHNTACAT